MNQIARNIKDLVNLLNDYTDAYNRGTPIISDKDWDAMYYKLQQLEKETGIIYSDSPTQKIVYETKSNLTKKEHEYQPMLSLDKTKDVDVVQSFLSGHDWCAMFKMDGLSCRLTYKDGELVSGETRGNGIIGEDITHNIMVMSSVPKQIPVKETIIIDGEVICDKQSFEEYFSKDYENARNFASGSIRLLSSEESAARLLTFVAWDLVKGCEDIDFFFWRLEKLDD